MSGQLHLQNGQAPNRSNVCISGYQRGKDNFALSNFEDNGRRGYSFYDPDLKKDIWFPTSEHYLQFQKIKPESKKNYLGAFQRQRSPGAILSGIRDRNSPCYIKPADNFYMIAGVKFDSERWDLYKIYVQMQINAAKYQQSASFRKIIHRAIALGQQFGDGQGPATIIEDTATANHPEEIWGTGTTGNGSNILGNSQTAFATIVQENLALVDSCCKGDNTLRYYLMRRYIAAEDQYQSGLQPVLQKVRAGAGVANRQVDTADLGPSFVKKIDLREVGPQTSPPFPGRIAVPFANTGYYQAGTQTDLSAASKAFSAPSRPGLKGLKDYYHFAVNAMNIGRDHRYKVTPTLSMGRQFESLQGDALKTAILAQFKQTVEGCRTRSELQQAVPKIKASEGFRILAKGQGLTTVILRLETSSVKAFNKIVKDHKKHLSSGHCNTY